MNNLKSIQVETSTWKEVQKALQQNLVCIIPIGASCKEHGLHLPLNTDYVQAQWLSQQLAFRWLFGQLLVLDFTQLLLNIQGVAQSPKTLL